MGTAKKIVKETLSKDIQRRSESPSPPGAGRAIGEETHIEITPDRIRLRAYEIYEARNGAPGDALSDWVRAEGELNGADPDATTDTPLEVKVREGGGSVLGAQKR